MPTEHGAPAGREGHLPVVAPHAAAAAACCCCLLLLIGSDVSKRRLCLGECEGHDAAAAAAMDSRGACLWPQLSSKRCAACLLLVAVWGGSDLRQFPCSMLRNRSSRPARMSKKQARGVVVSVVPEDAIQRRSDARIGSIAASAPAILFPHTHQSKDPTDPHHAYHTTEDRSTRSWWLSFLFPSSFSSSWRSCCPSGLGRCRPPPLPVVLPSSRRPRPLAAAAAAAGKATGPTRRPRVGWTPQ